jgi:1-acyl-sn-glycerol-3-phosphate acyltransferase
MKPAFCFFARKFVAPIIEFFVEEIKGKENIPQDTNFILASNHQTNLDHLFVPLPIKDKLEKAHFIGKQDNVLQFLLASWFYWLAETIPVNRKAKDKRKVLEKATEALKNGQIIIIYPEGTRNRKRELLLGKTGAAELAVRSGVPVVPMGVIYKDHRPRHFPLCLNIGKPLYFKEGLDYENLREITDKIMREISFLSGKPYIKSANKDFQP